MAGQFDQLFFLMLLILDTMSSKLESISTNLYDSLLNVEVQEEIISLTYYSLQKVINLAIIVSFN